MGAGASWQGRIRELEEIRAELAEKELVLLGKEQELLERDQTVQVLREEVSARHTIHLGIQSPRHPLLEGSTLSVEPDHIAGILPSQAHLPALLWVREVLVSHLKPLLMCSWTWNGSCAPC